MKKSSIWQRSDSGVFFELGGLLIPNIFYMFAVPLSGSNIYENSYYVEKKYLLADSNVQTLSLLDIIC